MLEDFTEMVTWGNSFRRFKTILNEEETVCQNILTQTIELVDKE